MPVRVIGAEHAGAAVCRRVTCGPECVDPRFDRVGPARQLLRAAASLAAVGAGAALILASAAIPGYGRIRRAGWAHRHASRWLLRALGVTVRSIGGPRPGPSLVVGNHVSFLDLLVLGAAAPMRFVAKSDVAGWPLIGRLAARIGAIFLRRNSLRAVPVLVSKMSRALRGGYRVQVFPEGTTRCGRSLTTFRRAAFQAALDTAVVVSPVALSYTDARSRPCPAAAFLGDETLLTCLRRVLAAERLTVTVHWLPVVPAIPATGHRATDRRRLAQQVERAVAAALAQPVVGRPRVLEPRHRPPVPTGPVAA